MTRHLNPSFPDRPFGLLLVEGGDERRLCEAVAGPATWQGLVCWRSEGRFDLRNTARNARNAPNFDRARSVGIVLDMEQDAAEALKLASEALEVFGNEAPPQHGALVTAGPLKLGAFLSPDGQRLGCIEHLCRQAVRNPALAACVDSLVDCAKTNHAKPQDADKAWLSAYMAMLPDPRMRLHNEEVFTPGRGGIDPDHSAFNPLRRFLQSL